MKGPTQDCLVPGTQLTVALVQMCSTHEVERNRVNALTHLETAARQRAQWVLFPENVLYVRREGDPGDWRQPLTGAFIQSFRDAAREHQLSILLGSIPEPLPGSGRVYNTSVLIAPDGTVRAVYRKLHLFDAILPNGRVLNESDSVERGKELVVSSVSGFRVGLTICYDLRFPELYRALTVAGADIITVPSAFTGLTGEAHWEVLLRARAIENQVFIVAPAQTGEHAPSRTSFGHSLIIDPWGRVVASAGVEEGVIVATLDVDQVRVMRERMPCMKHRRLEVAGLNAASLMGSPPAVV